MQGDVFTNRQDATDKKASLTDLLLKPDLASSDTEETASPRSTQSQTFFTNESGAVVDTVARSDNTYLVVSPMVAHAHAMESQPAT